jgi:glycosyltransferase involved in cell wall biosynthesis
MKVMVIGRCLPEYNSSYGMFEFDQARALSQKGLDVVYAYSDNRSIKIRRRFGFNKTYRDNIKCVGISFPSGGLPSNLYDCIKTRALMRIVRYLDGQNWTPDVVYAHFPLLTLTREFVSNLTESTIPLVCMEHWTQVLEGNLSKRNKALLDFCVSHAAYYCCVSEDLKLAVQKETDTQSNRILVIPNYVKSPPRIKSETLKGDAVVQFISAGRIEPVKCFGLLVRAFMQCAQEINAVLLIAGEGSLKRSLQREVDRAKMNDRIIFLGWQTKEELYQLLYSSDIYVTASSVETFGMPIVESWLTGLPCVAANNNALRSYFSDSNGLLFKVDDLSSLRKMLMKAAAKSRNGSYRPREIETKAKNEFSEESVLTQIVNCLKSASYKYE